jgi:hypothetical protein
VHEIPEADARRFVLAHHYSGSYPAARFRAGIFTKEPFRAERLAGVAVFSVPMSQNVIPAYFPHASPSEGVELGRFVLEDELAANAETWFLARAFRLLQARLKNLHGVVSYCDPMKRLNMHGETVFPGHLGTIYRAFNGAARGRSRARTLLLTPNGAVFSERTIQKLKSEECGIEYALRDLLQRGAPARKPFESGADYFGRLRASGFFRAVRHPGNLVFSWGFRHGS